MDQTSPPLTVYLARDRWLALARGETLPERSEGCALVADISGFTLLTERLARTLGARRGAEALSWQLNQVYDALIALVDQAGGSVISFAGDGILCWFEGDQGARALPCALAMQAALAQVATRSVLPGDPLVLALKVAVVQGPSQRFVVGDPAYQLLDILAGATLDRLAATEQQAQKGEVLLDEATARQLIDQIDIVAWREGADHARYAVVGAWRGAESPLAPPEPLPELPPEQLRPWLLPALYRRLGRGQGEFLTELRPVVTLFLHFSGIDYDQDGAAREKLDRFVRGVQRLLARYEGTLLDLVMGDKGSYLYVAFGAPVAHEDDATRAVWVAWEALRLPATLGTVEALRIGLSRGTMRVGTYGGATRRTYGVLGDEVNVAARLMEHAQAGQVLATGRVQVVTSQRFRWHALPPIQAKGKAEPLPLFLLAGPQPMTQGATPLRWATSPLVGRQRELALIEARLDEAARGRGQIVGLVAGAGMGKSRLLAELLQQAQARGLSSITGSCHSYGRNTPYLVWQPIWRALLGLEGAEQPQVRLAESVAQLDPALLPRLPLLGPVLNLPLADSALTASLDPALRKQSRESLLVALLRALLPRYPAPLLLVLEDAHWLDPLSHDLLEVVGRVIEGLPVMLLLAYRPPELVRLQAPRVNTLPHFLRLPLQELPPAEAEQLIRQRLEAERLTEPLVARLIERTQGNPFYIEELIHYLQDQVGEAGRPLAELELPASLHSLILSRIDQLTERQQITLKVASVIGRLFRLSWLLGYYPTLGAAEQVQRDLAHLAQQELTALESPEPEPTYLFKHIVTQEVAYESMPYAMRASLHERLARYLERLAEEGTEQPLTFLDLLAYHYEQSENLPKKCHYLRCAGEAAQVAYANEAALSYYQRLLPLLPPEAEERRTVQLQLGKVLEGVGRWEEAATHYEDSLQQSPPEAWCHLAECQQALGSLRSRQGEHEAALTWLLAAKAGLEAQGTQPEARALLSRVLTDLAFVYYRRGEYERVEHYYGHSLALARELGEKQAMAGALAGLGHVACDQGRYELARTHYAESLALAREIGFKKGMASALNNLGVVAYDQGDYPTAHHYQAESLALAREIGNQLSVTISLNNLGLLGLAQGSAEEAHRHYQESLTLARELGDKQLIAYGLVGMAGVAALAQAPQQAARLGAAAQQLLRSLGVVLEPEEQAAYERALQVARAALDPATFDIAWAEGEALSLEGAIAAALDAERQR